MLETGYVKYRVAQDKYEFTRNLFNIVTILPNIQH